MPTRVLFVCTGNLCRSPMAAGLAQAALGKDSGVVFRSAGFVKAGRPATKEAIQVMAELGVDISGHRSALVRDTIGSRPDLILCMTRQHLRSVVDLDPSLITRTLTLAEMAELCQQHGPRTENEALAEYLRKYADIHRLQQLALSNGSGDIVDPIGRPLAEYRECIRTISGYLEVLRSVWRY